MVKKWQIGDLVYIPQSVRLRKETSTGVTTDYVQLDNPATLLVTGPHQRGYEVVYQGTRWLVNESDTYPVPA